MSLALGLALSPATRGSGDDVVAELPPGVRCVWDAETAFHEITPTRERICLNGLWRWQPADARIAPDNVPARAWGFFKVPGCWPGITDYMQKDSQTLHPHPAWQSVKLAGVTAAWYEREFSVPAGWDGRRVSLAVEYLNSHATVFVDGAKAGELHFPGGELDLSAHCRPGACHRLSLHVPALPLKGVLLSYTDSAAAREVSGAVQRRGLCGDVFLVGAPRGPRVAEVSVETRVAERKLGVSAALEGLDAAGRYRLGVRVAKEGVTVREFASPEFRGEALVGGRLAFTEEWLPEQRWNLHTPKHQFDLEVTLVDGAGRTLDAAWPERFGVREFAIEGRDFHLNGTRLFLSAVPLDNAQVGAAQASYAAARESLERLKAIGINYVYTHNYGCEPGAHLGFTEILRAADDVGMLVGFTQPHFSHYDWKAPDADDGNGYARHAALYARAAGNHPSVVAYVLSHNATGYDEDMNPDLMDGRHAVRDQWASNNVRLALRAEAIVRRLDPRRLVYHHASGNLGVLHNSNFYPNFAPAQELDDWFEHWATAGVKPVFTCEYGAPFTWDWTMYRGWYQGQREWGSAKVPWEFCLAEWNAQFLGDRAYQISDAEQANLRWEAAQFRAGRVWHRWDYPSPVGSDRFEERYPVFARYLTDNWRAFRAWGVSGISPWEFQHFWKLRPGVTKGRRNLPVDWGNLQRPGFSPDYVDAHYERMDLAYERDDWVATPAAEALLRNNRPLLAWLGGKPAAFTSKDHNFAPGEAVEKQIILVNNSRESVTCEAAWACDAVPHARGNSRVTVAAGDQARLPIRVELPATLPARSYELRLSARFDTGETQEDRFTLHVVPPMAPVAAALSGRRVALFDPNGETARQLAAIRVRTESVGAEADLHDQEILIVGKAALTLDGPAPDLSRVRDGLKVIVFEQTAEVMEQRLGFRVAEYGLRQLFPRAPDHPVLSGLGPEHLRDWRGAATLLPPRLKYELRPRLGPTVEWAGLRVPRLWRCGNRGNVASVLLEKPARGDFLPLLDGGFSLQYSPLLEYREGAGLVVFCQLDVTGRTESDPAADTILRNLLRHVAEWQPAPRQRAVYAGETAGLAWLESVAAPVRRLDGRLAREETLVLGPGAGEALANHRAALEGFLQAGGKLLAVGLDQTEATALLPGPVKLRKAEHIAAWFEPCPMGSPFVGVAPADVHNRDPRELFLVSSGAHVLGNGVLAVADTGNVVFFQMPPWRFAGAAQPNLKKTHRRASCALTRVLANLGVAGQPPLLERFTRPVADAKAEARWREGLYLDRPEEWDDPYRFFRW